MGIRGEVFSTRVALQNRTYFFNVKENRMGDLYLNIVESKNKETGGFDRQSLVLFADDLQEFLSGFDDSLKVLEKAVREKRREGRGAQGHAPQNRGPEARDGYKGRPGGDFRDGPKHGRPKSFSKNTPKDKARGSSSRDAQKGSAKNRKIVVRKSRNKD